MIATLKESSHSASAPDCFRSDHGMYFHPRCAKKSTAKTNYSSSIVFGAEAANRQQLSDKLGKGK